LIPNLSPSANAYPSIRPLRSGHVTTQSREISANSPFTERKQIADHKLLCRILLKKPFFFWTDFFHQAHKSDSLLYQILVTDAGAKAKYGANAKAIDHLVRSLCDPEFERVRHLNLAWKIWEKLLVAHGGDNHLKARLFVSYRMQYENFTQLPGEDIDAMFQRFTAIVNNMKANVEDFPYTKHDQDLKLLHVLDPNVWGAKVEAIKESGQYLTIELDDLFSKLKSAEDDRKLQSKHEGSTDHSLALVGGSKGKSNPSC
jgi:hypothetical protein